MDDAEHAFFRCKVYTEEREQLQHSIGALLEPETVVEVMLRGPESWDKIACYFRHVITKKGKRSGNTANDQPRTLGLEGQCSKRYVCLCARE